MKKTWLHISIVLCVAIAADKAIGSALKWLLAHQKSGGYFEMKQKLTQLTPQIAIIGSSRAEAHYNPEIFEKKCGYSTINYGMSGSHLVSEYIALSIIIQHNPQLKTVVLDVTPYELSMLPDYNEVHDFYSLINDCPIVKSVAVQHLPFEKYKLTSSLYVYNSTVPEMLAGYLRKPAKFHKITGFIQSPETDFKPVFGKIERKEIYRESIELLDSIYTICMRANKQLVICVSPYFGDATESNSMAFLKDFCFRKGLRLMDYSSKEMYLKSPELFRDEKHLNYRGANLFTEQFIDDIFVKNGSLP